MSLINRDRPGARHQGAIAAHDAAMHIDSVSVQSSERLCRPTRDQHAHASRADGGAPQGDPKDMPPPRPLVTDNEWKPCRTASARRTSS
jgi:hypothetical protein